MDDPVPASSRPRSSRDRRLSVALVTLADTLTSDYSLIDLLETLVAKSIELLGTDEGGLLIADPSTSQLRSVVSTHGGPRRLEAEQLATRRGPSITSFETGEPVSIDDIETDAERWPDFRDSARREGFRSLHSFPLRLRGTVIGVMNLFGRTPRTFDAQDVAAGQALTDVATISILQQRTLEDSVRLTQQLQHALDSRVVIEQAKGVIAHSEKVSLDEAFNILRAHARNSRRPLSEIAAEVIHRSLNGRRDRS